MDYYWRHREILLSKSTIRANGGGWYKYFITNQWGCSVSDSIFINDIRMLPQVQIRIQSINCLTKEQQINPISTEKIAIQLDGSRRISINISKSDHFDSRNLFSQYYKCCRCRLVEQVVLSKYFGPVLKVAKQDISCPWDSAFVLMSSDVEYGNMHGVDQSFLSNSDRFLRSIRYIFALQQTHKMVLYTHHRWHQKIQTILRISDSPRRIITAINLPGQFNSKTL